MPARYVRVSSVKQDVEFSSVDIRPMHELDVPVIVAIERDAYQFPWSEGIFRDCLRVGYQCTILELDFVLVGYGIIASGAGEAHLLNVCVREEFRNRGFGRALLGKLLQLAAQAGEQAVLVVQVAARDFVALGMR